MNRFGRLAVIFGVGLLGAAGIVGALAGPGGSFVASLDGPQTGAAASGDDSSEDSAGSDVEVLGEVLDCSPVGPGPEDVQSKFETEANEFEVIGTLDAFDGVTVVVAGPSGDVSATLGLNFELKGDLTPGAFVKMEGTVAADSSMTAREVKSVCPGVGVIDCAAGEDPRLKLEVQGDAFKVVGTLDSLSDTLVAVVGPGALIEATVDAGTEINIDPASPAGTPVKVEGTIVGSDFVARQIKSACPDEVAPDAPVPDEVDAPAIEDDEECNRGPGGSGDLRAKVEGNEIEIERGTVLSFDGGALTVDAPGGPFTVMIDSGTKVDGDLSAATEVRVKGTLTDGTTVDAHEAKALCPDAAHHGEDDGQDAGLNENDGDDDGDRGGSSGSGGGHDDDDEGRED